jgi:predicted nucleotidyltransferase
MSSIVKRVIVENKLSHPDCVTSGLHYEVATGSVAYGTSGYGSDLDIYGFAIPPKEDIFPHLRGEILGFGRYAKRFDQWQAHHVKDKIIENRNYDFTIFNIVKFFSLCMENNPNMIDVLYVPENCMLFSTDIGKFVRNNRKLFLHKGCWYKFKGYAYSQMHKMRIKNPEPGSKREESIKIFGYDTKFAMHLVRLLLEVEQILTEGDLDLQRHKDQLRTIKDGEWTQKRVEDFFAKKELSLEKVYNECDIIPYKPDEKAIKKLLLECLRMEYGSLEDCICLQENK